MKKNKSDSKSSSKKNWFKKNDDSLLFESREKNVRHVENNLSFLNDSNKLEGDFGQVENMQDIWGLGRGDDSVRHRKRNVILRFVIASLAFIFVLSLVFYILPNVLPSFFKGSNIELFVEKPVNLVYDDSYYVVNTTVAVLRESPDNSSYRVTEVLYNEPVRVLQLDGGNGYSLIETTDGIQGYILTNNMIADRDSIEPDLHEYKLIVSENCKNVMTHASNGTLITKVMMNTVLYADVKRDGVYQVYLPGGEIGWIGSSGVIEIGPREEIEAVSCRYFVSSALSFVNSMYITNGISMNGLSVNGLVYVCSCVNGIPMPRTIEEQMRMGTEVVPGYDVVTSELIIEDIIPGDIVFLAAPHENATENSQVYEMAVCTDTGTLLMVSKAGTTIRLINFNSDSDICQRIITVRRVFD